MCIALFLVFPSGSSATKHNTVISWSKVSSSQYTFVRWERLLSFKEEVWIVFLIIYVFL